MTFLSERCARTNRDSETFYLHCLRCTKFRTSAAAEAASCWSAVNHALAAAVARQLERAFPSIQVPRGQAGPALEQDAEADTAPSSNDDGMHVDTEILRAADTHSVRRSPRVLRLPSGSVESLVVSPLPTQPQLARNADFGLQEFPEKAPTLLECERFQPPTCGAPHRAIEAGGDPRHPN